jgi:hypothetical protein
LEKKFLEDGIFHDLPWKIPYFGGMYKSSDSDSMFAWDTLKGRIFPVLAIWAAVGLCWTAAQFGASEASFRFGNVTGSQFFFELGDVLCWPARGLYREAQVKAYRKALSRIQESSKTTYKQKITSLELLANMGGKDFVDKYYTLLVETGEKPSVPLWVEYGIYVSVCGLWGFLVASLGASGTLLFMAWRPNAHG